MGQDSKNFSFGKWATKPMLVNLPKKEAKKIEEERKRADTIDKEKKRAAFEKYKTRSIGLWGCLPILVSFAWVVYHIAIYKDLTWAFLIPIAIPFGLLIWAYNINAEWDNRLEAKAEISSSDREYKWGPKVYSDAYIYTDSLWDIIGYWSGKLVAYAFALAVVVGVLGVIANRSYDRGYPWGPKEQAFVYFLIAGIVAFLDYLNTKVDLIRQERLGKATNWVAVGIARSARNAMFFFCGAFILIMFYFGWPFGFWTSLMLLGFISFFAWGAHADYNRLWASKVDKESDFY